MLAVIAIILILISLLLPNLNSSREVARRAICLSQLHQHMVAARGYVNDRSKMLPDMTGAETINGVNKIYRYADRLVLFNYISAYDVFFCPSQDPDKLAKLSGGVEVVPRIAPFYDGGTRLDYGINHYGRGDNKTDLYFDSLGDHYDNPNSPWASATLRPDFVGNQDAVCYSDADSNASPWDIGGNARGSKVWPLHASFETHAYKRHLGGYNAVGLDTSAQWRSSVNAVNPWEPWYIKRGRQNPNRP
ncbi:MAG: hypothetical protein WD768_18785 [Phycisphaeraceae bacterium]